MARFRFAYPCLKAWAGSCPLWKLLVGVPAIHIAVNQIDQRRRRVKKVAQGVSRGCAVKTVSSPGGATRIRWPTRGGRRLCRASGACLHYRTIPSADALGYLPDAPPALFLVIRCILDRLEFLVHAITPRRGVVRAFTNHLFETRFRAPAATAILILPAPKASQRKLPGQVGARLDRESFGFEIQHKRHRPTAAFAHRQVTCRLQPDPHRKRTLVDRHLEIAFFSL